MGGRNLNISLYLRKLVRHFEHYFMSNVKFPVPVEEPNYLGRKVQVHKLFYKILSVFVYSVLLEASPIWYPHKV